MFKTRNGTSLASVTGGAELNGTLGASYDVRPGCKLYFAMVYDNNNALLVRPGVTLRFH
jgi:hypothetical protein